MENNCRGITSLLRANEFVANRIEQSANGRVCKLAKLDKRMP